MTTWIQEKPYKIVKKWPRRVIVSFKSDYFEKVRDRLEDIEKSALWKKSKKLYFV